MPSGPAPSGGLQPQAASARASDFAAAITSGTKPSSSSQIVKNAIGGTIGGVLAEAILFPVDTIKIQVQTTAPGEPTGFVTTALRIIRRDGLFGFYHGLGGALFKETIHSANFWLFHGMLFRFGTRFGETTRTPPMVRLLLNLFAKQLNWLCTTPFEVVSTVNQISSTRAGFVGTAVQLFREGGFSIFYRGLFISMFLAINPAIMNTLITSLLRVASLWKQARGMDALEAKDHSAMAVGVVTGVSKGFATCVTYPLIRVKVLQQTTSGGAGSVMEVLRGIIAAEGAAGLYRGVLAMSYKTVLWNSLMMAFKHMLGPKKELTPPTSPTPRSRFPMVRMPLMAREPFPAELLTEEKLDEILRYVRGSNSEVTAVSGHSRRLSTLESRVEEATSDIREVKNLLQQLVSARTGGETAAAPQ